MGGQCIDLPVLITIEKPQVWLSQAASSGNLASDRLSAADIAFRTHTLRSLPRRATRGTRVCVALTREGRSKLCILCAAAWSALYQAKRS